jgi:hypothetical protein
MQFTCSAIAAFDLDGGVVDAKFRLQFRRQIV